MSGHVFESVHTHTNKKKIFLDQPLAHVFETTRIVPWSIELSPNWISIFVIVFCWNSRDKVNELSLLLTFSLELELTIVVAISFSTWHSTLYSTSSQNVSGLKHSYVFPLNVH